MPGVHLGLYSQILGVCLHVFSLVDDHAAGDPPVYGCFSVMGKIHAEGRFEYSDDFFKVGSQLSLSQAPLFWKEFIKSDLAILTISFAICKQERTKSGFPAAIALFGHVGILCCIWVLCKSYSAFSLNSFKPFGSVITRSRQHDSSA